MAKYKLEKNLQPTKDGKWLYHAQFVPEWTVREEELLDNVRERTALTSADLKSALQILQDLMVEALRAGRNVELPGIGTFSVVLKHRPIEDKAKIRAESIRFRDVTFRSCSQLRNRLAGMTFSRVESEEPSVLTDEEREQRTLAYLETHPYINRQDVCRAQRVPCQQIRGRPSPDAARRKADAQAVRERLALFTRPRGVKCTALSFKNGNPVGADSWVRLIRWFHIKADTQVCPYS